ncbi:hypothetical protein GXP67_00445 [Rhodocytophaga rosea]|uniref:Uncharacterized protein n=1 Tax=Rhodocytophaga rosea TaxID=2704465 RepID=A0A6C0GBA5_9BACT|nr:hypothetical protein [Rhodocytophaga rosea]QHT65249.1 hypothetical protein GXP67_00445 [Rhodocytophaga rosea]
MTVELCRSGKSTSEVAVELGLRRNWSASGSESMSKVKKEVFQGMRSLPYLLNRLKKQLWEAELERDMELMLTT